MRSRKLNPCLASKWRTGLFSNVGDLLRTWQSFDWRVAIGIFAAYFVIDAMYVYYTYMVTERRPLAAANISFVMHFMLAAGVLSYTHNPLYILPLSAGSWAGTYWFTWLSLRRRSAS